VDLWEAVNQILNIERLMRDNRSKNQEKPPNQFVGPRSPEEVNEYRKRQALGKALEQMQQPIEPSEPDFIKERNDP
jgi:hypothetical protein